MTSSLKSRMGGRGLVVFVLEPAVLLSLDCDCILTALSSLLIFVCP